LLGLARYFLDLLWTESGGIFRRHAGWRCTGALAQDSTKASAGDERGKHCRIQASEKLIQHSRLLLGVGLSKEITDHLSEWWRLIRSKRFAQPVANHLWRRILCNVVKMIRWIARRLDGAPAKVLLQNTA